MQIAILLAASLTGTSFAKPNIIVILADDLGYADIGVNGYSTDIATPHIDSIAKNGVRFTDGYATHAVCSPSRAGLMSGMYQHRFGFEHNSGPVRYAARNYGVPRSAPTMAEKLKKGGYATGMTGKWHIGFKEGLRPPERGFDFFFGFIGGARTYYPDVDEKEPLLRNNEPVENEKEYLTDAFTRESVDFIKKNKNRPFFLYVAYNAVHTPMEATKKYIDRFPKIKDQNRQILAGMLAAMDDGVGRIMDTLRRLDLEENTLVFFYSDNGGITPDNASRNDPLRGMKGTRYEGGIRVPFFTQWKGKFKEGTVYKKPVMGFDVHATALAAAGIEVPKNEPIDGVNLIPYLTGKNDGWPHEKLFWRSGKKHAARVGDWKMVVNRNDDSPMLFNLKNDISEKRNLANRYPEKLKALESAYAGWDAKMMSPKWIRQDKNNALAGGKLLPRSQWKKRKKKIRE